MTSQGRGLQDWLRAFVDSHPGGWDHNAWIGLLADLSRNGHDTSDSESIGRDLERERVRAVLEGSGVKGLGPKRRDALVAHFGSLWALRQASADEIAELPQVHRDLAEAILDAIR